MAPEFFSTMAQTASALIGFLITIVLVIHQLNQQERRTRTEELRSHLLDIQKKYKEVPFTVMEAIDQPFSQNISTNKDLNETSIQEIIEDANPGSNSIPVATKIWLLSYKIDSIISDISPAESPERDRLLNNGEIQQLIKACEYILDETEGKDSGLIAEINDKDQAEEVGVSTSIFKMDDIDYPDLDQWFNEVLGEEDRRRSLDGSDILSISNLINELNEDMKKAERLADNTILTNTTIISQTKVPFTVMLLSGVILPLSALIPPPIRYLSITGSELIFYQSTLLAVSFLSFFWLLFRINDEI